MMGGRGNNGNRNQPTGFKLSDVSNILSSNYSNSRDIEWVENILTNLGRKLKQSEFKIESVRIGERWLGGSEWAYKIVPPEDLKLNGLSRAYTKKTAQEIIRSLVSQYNTWFEERNK